MCSMPGSTWSSRKLPWPAMKRSSSCRFTEWPMPPISAVVVGLAAVSGHADAPRGQAVATGAAAAARIALTMFM